MAKLEEYGRVRACPKPPVILQEVPSPASKTKFQR